MRDAAEDEADWYTSITNLFDEVAEKFLVLLKSIELVDDDDRDLEATL